jgi:hypothetical protein
MGITKKLKCKNNSISLKHRGKYCTIAKQSNIFIKNNACIGLSIKSRGRIYDAKLKNKTKPKTSQKLNSPVNLMIINALITSHSCCLTLLVG